MAKNQEGFDISKFSWVECFLNTNGKTSSTKLIGLIASLICLTLFVVMFIFYMFNMGEASTIIELIDKIITVFGISAGLMGIKSISSSINNRRTQISAEPEDEEIHHRKREMLTD